MEENQKAKLKESPEGFENCEESSRARMSFSIFDMVVIQNTPMTIIAMNNVIYMHDKERKMKQLFCDALFL